jgi:hypothetical protein
LFNIHLVRIKCEGLPQGDFLREESEPVSVITKSFQFKPTADVGRGSEWHIGNVEALQDAGVAFAMGRTQAVRTPQFDADTHNFLEEEALRAPFTLGVFDSTTQACGIIKKAGVSQSVIEISGKLEILLNSAPFAREANSRIVVEPISDPVNFIEAVRSAAFVTKFSFTVTRPNPADVNRLIQGPAKNFTSEIGGDRSKIEVEGDSLNPDIIVDVANAVAADGEQATATIRETPKGSIKRIYLSSNPVLERVETSPYDSVIQSILESTRRAYRRVRGKTD